MAPFKLQLTQFPIAYMMMYLLKWKVLNPSFDYLCVMNHVNYLTDVVSFKNVDLC